MNKLYAIIPFIIMLLCKAEKSFAMEHHAHQTIFLICIEQAMKAAIQMPPNKEILAEAFNIIENLDMEKVYINSRDSKGGSALHSAAAYGLLGHVQFLIEHGAQASMLYAESMNGNTPLHIAAWFGHQEVARYLAEQNPKTKTTKNNFDSAPWILALHNNYKELATLLNPNRQ